MRTKNIFIRVFLISFIFWYSLFSVRAPVLIYADEQDPTPTATASVEFSSVGESASPTPTEEPTSADEISSGESPSPSVSPTPTPTSTSEETYEDVTESSETEQEASPTPTPSDSLEITNGVGSSVLLSKDPPEMGVSSEEGDEASSGLGETLVVSDQSADSLTVADSSATTGDNLSSGDISQMLTGDALALANSLGFANISLIGPNVYYLLDTITGQENGDINFYEKFLELILSSSLDGSPDLTVINNQDADQSVSSYAVSDSGDNVVLANESDTETGDATAIANSINLANFLLIGSNGIFSVVNISGVLNGNIILPNLSSMEGSLPWQVINIQNTQTASTTTLSEAVSSSGENTLEATGSMNTGNATSVSNSVSVANILKIGDSWGLVFLNIFGNWQGYVENWDMPGTSSQLGYGSSILEMDSGSPNDYSDDDGSLTVVSSQKANLVTTSFSNANTGENTVRGESGNLTTGEALSVSNSFSLANLVGIGENFFVGVFNVIGDWFGNLVIAYPDLQVSITDNKDEVTSGEEVEYSITLKNVGDAYAKNISLELATPKEFVNQGSSGWSVPSLSPGEQLSFTSRGYISLDATAGTQLASSIVALTDDKEESKDNNTASDTTKLIMLTSVAGEDASEDHTLPLLQVYIDNNVNEFVYPGDTILAQMTVENKGPVKAKSVEINGSLSNDYPMPAIPLGKSLGDIDSGEKVSITFGISLINDLPGGDYHLAAYAKGYNLAGDEVVSSEAHSDFFVKLLGHTQKAFSSANTSEGEILGMATGGDLPPSSGNFITRWKEYLPYALALSLVGLLIVTMAKRKLRGEELLPLPAFSLKRYLNKEVFRRFALKAAGIVGLFLGIFLFVSKIFRRN